MSVAAGVEHRVSSADDHHRTWLNPLLDPPANDRVHLGDRLRVKRQSGKAEHERGPDRQAEPPEQRATCLHQRTPAGSRTGPGWSW